MLAACSTRLDPAPVISHSASLLSANGTIASAATLGRTPLGYYRVKLGDTLYRIALENEQNYRDIAAWNNLKNTSPIEINQLLRVSPPGINVAASLPSIGNTTNLAPSHDSASIIASIPIQTDASVKNINFVWPICGLVLSPFDKLKNKGLNLIGAFGATIKASEDGRIVYAGDGLHGYRNLIIIKHDEQYLTAYAHNGILLVKEGDFVIKNQVIAEMGGVNSDKAILHFEIRKQGKPIDPMNYLPPQ
ncbi:peptidoglycan DD-metalloendopeptidase family protein [Candidatus Vallotiella sp. (ex Adelges kitamiensis)]|uniref:peptidoglycan DD-metalloendopeptidase family protein n=1 Tax=Candidatus Vallotiella sp. (ex Adelges kitamiensis) TaxID=2864217 RepID=UPI001CE3A2F7|nr:peptidoglycan DD-metalloendopeptidase family protein [Candidatus Vallotia sp. (ex Adelges kitamiensis)]